MIINSTQYPPLAVLRGHLSEKKNHAKTVKKDMELQAVIISKWENPIDYIGRNQQKAFLSMLLYSGHFSVLCMAHRTQLKMPVTS